MTRAAVVGGGVAGLATAALLARGGLEVTLVERHDTLGGRAGRVTTHGFTFDSGPSWYVAPETYERFFALLGRRIEDYVTVVDLDPRFRAFFEGFSGAPADALDLALEADSNWELFDSFSRGDGEAARRYAAEAAADYGAVLEHSLYSTYDSPASLLRPEALRRAPRHFRDLYSTLDRRVAKAVHHPRVRQLLSFPAVALAGSPERLPSAYSFVSHLYLGTSIKHPTGGFASVVDALERAAREEGVDIRTSSDVARILVDPQSTSASGVVLHDGGVVSADIVVSCADLHHTETTLLAEEYRSLPESAWSDLHAAPSALVALVGVKKALPELAHHNLFFPRDWKATLADLSSDHPGLPALPAFLYVSRPSATERGVAPKGKEALVLMAPLPADPHLGATEASRTSLSDMTTKYLEQVGEWAQIPDLESRSTVLEIITPSDLSERYSAWQGSAMGLEHTRQQTAFSRPGNASRRVRNLFYAGSSTLPGVGVSSALVSAELVAKRLLKDRSTRPLTVPAQPGFLVGSQQQGPVDEPGDEAPDDTISPPEPRTEFTTIPALKDAPPLEPKPNPTVGETFLPEPED